MAQKNPPDLIEIVVRVRYEMNEMAHEKDAAQLAGIPLSWQCIDKEAEDNGVWTFTFRPH